jgi:hypothetical protein
MQTTLSSESQITIDVVTGKHIEVFAAFSNQRTHSSLDKLKQQQCWTM